jgi:hypothetical protein
MKDLSNFCKLFNINIPVEKHFEYYTNLLKNSDYKPDILELISAYNLYADTVDSPHGHKMASMQKVINFLAETDFYKIYNDDPEVTKRLADRKIEGVNRVSEVGNNPNVGYLSLDLSKANYQVLKSYDTNNIMCNSWDLLLDSLNINSIFKLSKPFRQHIFGNLNPKRSQRHQAIIMDDIDKHLKENAHGSLQLVLKTYDELIYAVECDDEEFIEWNKDWLREGGLLSSCYTAKKYKLTQSTFVLNKIGKDKYVKTYLDLDGYPIKRKLVGVEGNLFYMYLKKYIMNENEYDERDLLFQNDKRLAKWIDTL